MSGCIPRSFGQQLSFFRYEWSDIEDEYACRLDQARQLYARGILSFDPQAKSSLEEYELKELIFLVWLVFKSRLPASLTDMMLSQLVKPYYYSFAEIVWDNTKQQWILIAEYHEDYPELTPGELTKQVYSEKISSCANPALHAFLQKIHAACINGEMI